jgi:hypothetical protein
MLHGVFDVISLFDIYWAEHMPLGKDFLFGRVDILFGTERSLKLFVMKQ